MPATEFSKGSLGKELLLHAKRFLTAWSDMPGAGLESICSLSSDQVL